MKKILLIDGSNLMFRAYYATAYSGNLMKNSKGQYTNAVYGFIRMLNVILKEDFTHILVAFDKGKATFRHKAYEDYKAKRKPMPDEFRSQLDLIKQVPEKLGIKVYESEALEADDIIATLTKQHYNDLSDIEIISNDRDLFQLLNEKVRMRLSKKGLEPDQVYTKKTLKEDLNITPDQIPDLKGLMGDASDNLPGIPGVGEKTALKLLNEYGTIEAVLKHLNELKGKLKERVEKHGQEALKWRELATLKCDAKLPFALDDLAYRGYDDEELKAFYESLEFHSLIKALSKDTSKNDKLEAQNLVVLEKETQIEPLLATMKTMTFLIETELKENYHHAKNLGLGFLHDNTQYFIPYDVMIHSKALKTFLEDKTIPKTTFDMKKAMVLLSQDDIKLAGVTFDLLLAAYVLNPSNTKEDFKVVVSNFDYHEVEYDETIYGKGAKRTIPKPNTYRQHNAQKIIAIAALKDTLKKNLKDHAQEKLFYDIELPLAEVLATMEILGIDIDKKALKSYETTLNQKLESLEKSIHNHAGKTFNIASPKQLGDVLFDDLDLPVIKKTKTGYSTSIDVLKRLKDKHPIIDDIMEYRTLSKLKSAYVNGLFEAAGADDKIHTIFKQAYTQTGRLSSIEPNLQTIPIRSEQGRALRKVFIPKKDHILMAADYSQIELRLLAHLANEKTMIQAFKEDADIHAITGKEILNKDSLSADERRVAKAVNFGIIYGQSAWGLSEEMAISQKEASRFIQSYYEKFSGIKQYMNDVVKNAKKEGYVTTLFNRRRYIPELNSKIYAQRELGKRTAMNAPLQGSAADIIKVAMVAISKAMKAQNLKSTMLLQIHDELVFNVVPEEKDAMEKIIKKHMKEAADLKVPLTISLASGDNLDEAK